MSKRTLGQPSAASTAKTPAPSTASQPPATTGAAPGRAPPPQQDTAAASSPHKQPVESGSQPQTQMPQQEADPAAMKSLLKAINNLTYTIAKRTTGANNDPLVPSPAAGPRGKGPAKGQGPGTVDAVATRDSGNFPAHKGKGSKGKAKGKRKAKSGAPAGFQVQQRYDVASSATNTPDEWLSVSVYTRDNACYTCGNRWCKGAWHGTWDNDDAARYECNRTTWGSIGRMYDLGRTPKQIAAAFDVPKKVFSTWPTSQMSTFDQLKAVMEYFGGFPRWADGSGPRTIPPPPSEGWELEALREEQKGNIWIRGPSRVTQGPHAVQTLHPLPPEKADDWDNERNDAPMDTGSQSEGEVLAQSHTHHDLQARPSRSPSSQHGPKPSPGPDQKAATGFPFTAPHMGTRRGLDNGSKMTGAPGH